VKEEIDRDWHYNGKMWYEDPYINGKLHGLAKIWYDNGKIWYEIPYKNGLQCGAKVWYDHN